MTEQYRALYYYRANQNSINEGHLGEYVAIHDNHVEGYYKDFWNGVDAMADKKYPLGSFNVVKCLPDGEAEYDLGLIHVEGKPLWT